MEEILEEKLGDSSILLASALDGKVNLNLVVMATDAAIRQGAHAIQPVLRMR